MLTATVMVGISKVLLLLCQVLLQILSRFVIVFRGRRFLRSEIMTRWVVVEEVIEGIEGEGGWEMGIIMSLWTTGWRGAIRRGKGPVGGWGGRGMVVGLGVVVGGIEEWKNVF